MMKLLIAALGLTAAIAFTAPAFEVSSAQAATPAAATTKAPAKHTMKKKCHPTKKHKCPTHHAKKKKK